MALSHCWHPSTAKISHMNTQERRDTCFVNTCGWLYDSERDWAGELPDFGSHLLTQPNEVADLGYTLLFCIMLLLRISFIYFLLPEVMNMPLCDNRTDANSSSSDEWQSPGRDRLYLHWRGSSSVDTRLLQSSRAVAHHLRRRRRNL